MTTAVETIPMESFRLNKMPEFSTRYLDDYFAKYGSHIGREARKIMRPLHDPNISPPLPIKLKRPPFPAQSHAITAGVYALEKLLSIFVVGEMGTGKTLMAQGIVQQHAIMQLAKINTNRRGFRKAQLDPAAQPAYRCIVFCPPQLVPKWGREIMETVPNANVVTIEKWTDIITVYRKIGDRRPSKPTYYIISRETAKLSAKWVPSYRFNDGDPNPMCPQCGQPIKDEKDRLIPVSKLESRKHFCKALYETYSQDNTRESGDVLLKECRAPLWSYIGADSRVGADHKAVNSKELRGYNKWEPAKYIHKHMKGFFDYLIIDEVHEEKGADTAQANAVGALIAATKYHLALTGTLIGGYANHLRPLLWRMSGSKMKRLGYSWNGETPFNRDYGRIETVIRTVGGEFVDANKGSRGSKSSKTESVKPGIMPTLFGDLLMEQCVFLGLAEISENLPGLDEIVVPVPMDRRLADEYTDIEDTLRAVVTEMIARGDRRMLASMLQTLLCYPDHPFDWETIGYWNRPKPGEGGAAVTDGRRQANSKKKEIIGGQFVPVVTPKSLSKDFEYAKEVALLERVKLEIEEGRQAWVFVQYTGEKRNVSKRLLELFEKHGITARVLPASVPPAEREEWIAKYGKVNQVIISHPKLVETGLDLFDKNGGHNFATLIFYETGYNTFTLRQASRRSWRIGQGKRCRVIYFYYEGTMQSQAMELMGKKLTASLSLEGKFSSEGLAAMGADDGGIEMALAKKLANMERADESQTARAWEKIQSSNDSAKKSTLIETVKRKEKEVLSKKHAIDPKAALAEMEAFLNSMRTKKAAGK